MVVTVFRSRLQPEHAAEYYEVATRMRTLAEGMPGFVSFKTFRAEDGECVSAIEFASEEALRASVIRPYGFKRSNASPAAADL
jgi:heme-degrading monooxygenase HmoA